MNGTRSRPRLVVSSDGRGVVAHVGARLPADAAAREIAWAQHAETVGMFPRAMAAGRVITGLALDIDATIVICHSEKQDATPTWKKTFGYHPLLCFLDNTGEALSGILRPGRSGSNTARSANSLRLLAGLAAPYPAHAD